MTTNPMETVDTSWKGLYKWGGVSSLIIGVLLIVFVILEASLGTPSGGEAVLKLFANQTTLVYTACGVLMLIDILFVPVVLALYLALKGVNKNAMLAATGFAGLSLVLDLGVTYFTGCAYHSQPELCSCHK